MARKKRHSVIKTLNEISTRGVHIPIIMVIILLMAGLMIGYIWQKVKINQLAIEIEDLRKQKQILKERNEREKAKVLNLLDDLRIIKIAKQKLNMTFPAFEVLTLPENFKSQQKLIEKILTTNQLTLEMDF